MHEFTRHKKVTSQSTHLYFFRGVDRVVDNVYYSSQYLTACKNDVRIHLVHEFTRDHETHAQRSHTTVDPSLEVSLMTLATLVSKNYSKLRIHSMHKFIRKHGNSHTYSTQSHHCRFISICLPAHIRSSHLTCF